MLKQKFFITSFAVIAGLLLFSFQNCQFKKLSSNIELASAVDPLALQESLTAPDAAADLAGIALSPTQVTLSWVLPEQSVSKINIERSSDVAGPFVTIAVLNESAMAFNDIGLSAATTYHYRITFENNAGVSPYSIIASVSTADLIAPPLPPVIQPEDPLPPITLPPPSGSNLPATDPVVSPPPSDPVVTQPPTAEPIESNPPESGSSPSTGSPDQPVSDSPPAPPAAPSNLTVVSVSSSRAELAWADNSTNEYGFKVERATSSGGPFARLKSGEKNVTSYTVYSLAAGTTYYFRVSAYNSSGTSGYSNVVSVTTNP